jgi:ribosome modulation factor
MIKRPDAFQEGVDAYAQGVSRDLCPYLPGTVAEEQWLKGWDEGKAIRDRLFADEE